MSSAFKSNEALIASRICHDLAGPISAISNGIELMQLTGAPSAGGPEMELVTDSIQNLTERLRLCRVAFGTASESQSSSIPELQTVLKTLYQSRISIQWNTSESTVNLQIAKLLMLSVLCAETAVPMGGTITISGQGSQWQIQTTGETLSPPEVWNLLRGAESETDIIPALCQFILLPKSIAESGGKMKVETTSLHATITFNV